MSEGTEVDHIFDVLDEIRNALREILDLFAEDFTKDSLKDLKRHVDAVDDMV